MCKSLPQFFHLCKGDSTDISLMCSRFHFPFPVSSHTSTPCPNLGNFSTTVLQGITLSFCSHRENSCPSSIRHFILPGLEIQIISFCSPTVWTQNYLNICSLYPTSSIQMLGLSSSLAKLNIICRCLYIQLGLSHHITMPLFFFLFTLFHGFVASYGESRKETTTEKYKWIQQKL